MTPTIQTPPPEEVTLTQRAVRGTAWSTIATGGKQLLQIASVATVARVLGPGAYGIMAMAALLLAFVFCLRDLGTGTAIVQRSNINHRMLSSIFWLNFGVGIALAAFVSGLSPFMADFFKTPTLVPILSTLSLSIWFTSAGIVHNSILLREMRYKSLALADLGSALAGYLTALTCAHTGFGVWSLVFANLVTTGSNMMFYWLAAGWKPAFLFNRDDVRSVAGFSLNLSGAILVNFFARNADNIVIGRVRGQTELGDYQMAYNLMLTPISNISSMIAQITFPAFSRIQTDNARFRSAYVRQSMMVGLLTFPIMAGMGVLADPLIRSVLGSKWLGAIVVFQILAPVGLVQSVGTLVGQIYTAKGRTDYMFGWAVASTIGLVLAFIIGAHYGAVGVAVAYGITYILVLFLPSLLIPFTLIELKLSTYLYALLPQALITLAMACACIGWLFGFHLLGMHNSWLELITTSVLGCIVYVGLMIGFHPPVIDALEEILSGSGNPAVTKMLRLIRRR